MYILPGSVQAELASVMDKEFIWYYFLFDFLVPHFPPLTSPNWNSSSSHFRDFLSRLSGLQVQVRLPSLPTSDSLWYLAFTPGPTLLNHPYIPTLQLASEATHLQAFFLFVRYSQQRFLFPIPIYTLTYIYSSFLTWIFELSFYPFYY